jgi:hypothetical protein
LWWSTHRLWRAGDDQLRFAQQVAERQAGETNAQLAIAQKSADAAMEAARSSTNQAKIAEDAAERQLRAYVFDSAGGIVATCNGLIQEGTCSILIEIKNYGNTPAYKFDIIISAAIFEAEPDEFPSQGTKEVEGFNVLSPQTARDVIKTIDITYDEALSITAKTKRIFVWGEISYVDAFGHARWFKFYRRSGNLLTGKEFKWQLTPAAAPDQTDEYK